MVTYRSIDGSSNNEENSGWGKPGSQLMRFSQPLYATDGSSIADEGRPNPRDISNAIVATSELTETEIGVSNLFTFWGQFLDHDMSLTLDVGAPANIPLENGDSLGVPSIFFNRSQTDPNTGTGADNPLQQITSVTSFIDASMVYGSDETRNEYLRAEGGKLKVSDGNLLPLNYGSQDGLPADPASSVVAGDIRANENLALTSLHTLFVREHNRLVDEIADDHPEYDDETLYQEAKSIVEGEIQHITYNEFLPLLLGEDALPEYTGYDPNVDPSISQLFSTVAFRVGHSLLSPTLSLVDEHGNDNGSIALRDAFFRPANELTSDVMDGLLRGLARDKAQEVDNLVIDDVREFLVGEGFGTLGFDLAALNIQRGRDHGIPKYNDAREAIGLERYTSFSDMTDDVVVQERLASVYGSVDDIDAWIGGLCEDHVDGALVGEFFYTILVDQFTRSRDGDSFFYLNRFADHLEVIEQIEDTSIADILVRNTNIDYIYRDAFLGCEWIVGDEGNDNVTGTDRSDLVLGFEGNDVVRGGRGDDDVYGGNGNDVVRGGRGDDNVYGGNGKDKVHGGAGDDHVYGEDGRDDLFGGNGHDYLEGGRGDDYLSGGNGSDSLYGGKAYDYLEGGKGNDVLVGGTQADDLYGNAGKDIFKYYDEDESPASWNLNETDFIWDFEGAGASNIDKIDLSEVYNGLEFIGTDSFDAEGQVRVEEYFDRHDHERYTLVQVNTSGDRDAEMEIRVDDGDQTAEHWVDGDFVL